MPGLDDIEEAKAMFGTPLVAFLAASMLAQEDEPPAERSHSRVQGLGVRADFGAKQLLGVGYFRSHESDTRLGRGSLFWFGLGADVKLVVSGAGLEAATTAATARAGAMGCTGGFGLEGALGMGVGSRAVQGFGSLALFFSIDYVEFGYQLQFPIYPFAWPSWLSAHSFAVRLNFPLWREDLDVRG
ncbi:MAG TPA: hypothetical protein VE549_03630 [Myxococcaceae bacterium]|nr:hypothetical protein [Myxococcaceae bacterium]